MRRVPKEKTSRNVEESSNRISISDPQFFCLLPALVSNVQVELILRSLGLYNAKDTIVGNNSIRGVSGGERRRVTLGSDGRATVRWEEGRG